MTLDDFVSTFTSLEAVHLDSDTSRAEVSLRKGRDPWHVRLWHGHWQKGVNSGGCRNHFGKENDNNNVFKSISSGIRLKKKAILKRWLDSSADKKANNSEILQLAFIIKLMKNSHTSHTNIN